MSTKLDSRAQFHARVAAWNQREAKLREFALGNRTLPDLLDELQASEDEAEALARKVYDLEDEIDELKYQIMYGGER